MDRLKLSAKQAKFIKSLKIKKFRQQERVFLVEGKKNVQELLSSNYDIRYLICTHVFYESSLSLKKADQSKILFASPADLTSIGTLKTNNECLAVVNFEEKKSIPDHADHIFLFDGINDPGNLGTIIRTLDWFGFNHLVCAPETTDHFAPKVVNTSKGSFFRANIEVADLVDFIKSSSRTVYLVEMNGAPLSSINQESLSPSIFIMGSESHGISESIRALGNHSITIPNFGSAESLNVGIATGILCYQLRNC